MLTHLLCAETKNHFRHFNSGKKQRLLKTPTNLMTRDILISGLSSRSLSRRNKTLFVSFSCGTIFILGPSFLKALEGLLLKDEQTKKKHNLIFQTKANTETKICHTISHSKLFTLFIWKTSFVLFCILKYANSKPGVR